MKTKLTIEQSKRLIELGVNPASASYEAKSEFPIFTLTDLLSILPPHKPLVDAEAFLNIYFELCCDGWYVQYLDFDHDDDVIVEKSAPELIDALYSLCLWSIDREYIITSKND